MKNFISLSASTCMISTMFVTGLRATSIYRPPEPSLLSSNGDWSEYATLNDDKACFIVAQPRQRDASSNDRGASRVFISTRTGQKVYNEISIPMGLPLDAQSRSARAEIGASAFPLMGRGTTLWLRSSSDEVRMADAMRHNAKMTIFASSATGSALRDTYRLSGFGLIFDRANANCSR